MEGNTTENSTSTKELTRKLDLLLRTGEILMDSSAFSDCQKRICM